MVRIRLAFGASGPLRTHSALGHPTGDLLLQQVSARLRAWAPEECLVARLGGDEFAVLLNRAGGDAAAKVSRSLIEALHRPFTIDERTLRVAGSVGIALFPEHATSAEALMQRADVAMYRAKRARLGYAFYPLAIPPAPAKPLTPAPVGAEPAA